MEMINKENCCQFCQFRKELYKMEMPRECKECGFLGYRDKPYNMNIPIEEEDQNDAN